MTSKLFKASLLATALFAAVAAQPALAQNTYTPGIDQAQMQISTRIREGLQSGQITPSEAQVLYHRDSDLSLRESRAKSDGNVSPQERQQLRADSQNLKADVERMIANRNVTGQASVTPGIDKNEFKIHSRIEEGVRTAQINQREANRLYNRESRIERHEARFKADGVVTQQERQQLRRELTDLSEQVDRMTHNRRRG
jgi:hypothetical protein